MPAEGSLTLDVLAEIRTSFPERRGMGIVSIGEPGTMMAGGDVLCLWRAHRRP